jgi:hypothetical protein
MEEAVTHDVVRVVKIDPNSVSLRFGVLKTVVTFKIVPDGRLYDCIQSHHIHTPRQVGRYFSSHTSFESKHFAMRRAINNTAFYYNSAVNRATGATHSVLL